MLFGIPRLCTGCKPKWKSGTLNTSVDNRSTKRKCTFKKCTILLVFFFTGEDGPSTNHMTTQGRQEKREQVTHTASEWAAIYFNESGGVDVWWL